MINTYWFLIGIWCVLLVCVGIAACFRPLRLNIMRARYVIPIYTLLIFACFPTYVYLVGGRLEYPDSAVHRDYVYLLTFFVLPILVSIGYLHTTNRILLPHMRKVSLLVFILFWIISAIFWNVVLRLGPDPEALLGLAFIFIVAAFFSLLAFLVSLFWLIYKSVMTKKSQN